MPNLGHLCHPVRMASTLELTLSEVLRLARDRKGYSQTQLADVLELGRTTLIRYEGGKPVRRWRDVEAWLDACEASPDVRAAARGAWESARTVGWDHVWPDAA